MKSSASENSTNTLEKQSQPNKIPSDVWVTFRTNVKLQNQAPPIAPVSRHQNLPLSFHQERLWFIEQLQPHTSVHNLLHCLQLKGVLDLAALEKTLIEITRRHEILRTTISIVDGQPIQIISPNIDLKLPVVDLTELPPEQQQTEAQKLALEDAEQPFDLAKAPLWRFQLLRLGTEEHILLRTIHHIIFDGWSHSVFMRELGMIYKAFSTKEPSPLSELPIQYADYAQNQRQWLQGEVFSSQLDYWKQQLSGNISALELPTDYPPPAVPSYRGAYLPLEISENLTAALKKLSYEEGVTLFVTLLTAFKTLLYLYTEQEDMIVCSPVVGRHRVETRGLIGYFNNVVVMRTDLSEKPSFRELLRRVSRVSSESFAHQDIPLQKVAELPNLVRTSLTRAMFVFQNIPNQSLELEDLTVSSWYVDREIANFDLSLSLQESQGKITGGIQYKTELFKTDSINQMLENFHNLVESLVANPEQSISELPLLTAAKSRPEFDKKESSDHRFNQPNPETFVPPRNDLERQLIQIWQQVLGIQSVTVKDNFFKLGGDSLSGVRLFAKIEEVFGKNLALSTLFQAPTIEELANILSKEGYSVPPRVSMVAVQPLGSKPPLFLLNGLGEIPFAYWSLAYHLGTDRPVYSWESYGKRAVYTRVQDRASHYIKELRTLQPEGPYFIGGYCGGGIVAFEVAQQLQAQGQKVALLALFDYVPRLDDDQSKKLRKLDSSLYFFWDKIYLIKEFLQFPINEQIDRIQSRSMRLIKKLTRKIGKNKHKDRDNSPNPNPNPNPNPLTSPIEQTINYVLSQVPDDIHGEYRQSLEAQGRSFIEYVTKFYSGRVALLVSSRFSFWRFIKNQVAAAKVEVRVVPGSNHKNMLIEPYVQNLAKHLKDCLDKVSDQ